ncbi:hypothetical protein ACFWTE_27435 [Nocardiopsis sp. NPDC058631]|uniref:hypothetical protein n=1 Tax=Nocardiopsis sp. NPDC058631 TaxID=3346566 RepID=UPI0036633503
MTGIHGSTSASGARTAVLPSPVRRALLLAALLCGIMVTTWMAASDTARADEFPAATTLVYQAGTTAGAHTGEYVPVMATGLREPLSGTVAAVGESAARVVSHTSDTVVPETAIKGPDLTGQVRDTVHEVTDPVEHHLSGEPAPTPAAADRRTGHEVDGDDATENPAEDTGRPSAHEVHTPVRPSSPVSLVPHGADRNDEAPSGFAEPGTAPASASTAATAATSAPSGVPGGALVAGYLPALGAPAPAPGLFQAARHVLRSVPAESADEPTFSPD